MSRSLDNILTVSVGGAAGDGVREAGTTLGTLLTNVGFHTFMSFKYPSLIRGGHNYARISFSKEKVFYDYPHVDVLVALNEDTIKKQRHRLNPDGIILADQFDAEDLAMFGSRAVVLPMLQFTKDIGAAPITRSSAGLGAVCYLLDLPLEKMTDILKRVFENKGLEANLKLAQMGYEHVQKLSTRHTRALVPDVPDPNQQFVEGNAAFGRGLVVSGLDYFLAYPMTPSSSLLHYLAKKQDEFKIKVIQPENEISAINMALGIAYAGKRVAVGTATGGFALMQEAFSLAGISELPLVVMVSQRGGPATGLPTHSSQTDLRFVLHAGHGEFPRIVMAPADPVEAYRCGAHALNLAWKYQVPVIVLLDKHVSENMTSAVLPKGGGVEYGRVVDHVEGEYKRYAKTDDGISPMAFPGTPGAVVRATSYEHDEAGITTEELETVKLMQDKRYAKSAALARECANHESVEVYGDTSSSNVVVFWGSTKTAVLEAAKHFDKPAKLVQVIWMEPFPTERVARELTGAKVIVNVEMNHGAQLGGLIREKTGINIEKNILHYDSRPFDPLDLSDELNKYFI